MSHRIMTRALALLLTLLFALTAASALAEGSGEADDAQTEISEEIMPLLDFLKSLIPAPKVEPQPLTHEETVFALRELGIEIPDSAIQATEAAIVSIAQIYEEFGYSYTEQDYEFALYLLANIGYGEYDYDTWTWTPTSHEIYAFDAEIFNIEHMYRDFLLGVSAIVPGFEPAEVSEEIHEYEYDSTSALHLFSGAEGKTVVSFELNGTRYERELNFYGDWFDEDAIGWINTVLAAEGFEGRLYGLYDMGQSLILYYGDEDYDCKIRQITCYPLD